ncbi:extracellular matrix protein 2 isoform X1 [Labrus mixtus]|uniref:extracellular matrix protein 2 isoform X1 n=1 Tax=Labrus mixtus TaxID=508554 RepID=UPI0029C0EA71|nr:extracellular matrix protein 2 isoform X1 [Labrus mixtus]
MRWWLVVASLWLLLGLTIADAQTGHWNQDSGTRMQKRKRDGQGRQQARGGRLRPMKIRLIPGPSIPVEPKENHGNTLFLNSYKNVQEQHSTYNVIPGKQGHCVYQGLTMFNQAVWSPQPCVTCQCTRGQVVCDKITCPKTHCHFPFTPAGECCPVCMEPEPDLSLDISGDSPVPNDTDEDVTQAEIQRILWREEEEHREEEERLRKKDEARKKKRKQRKEQEEIQRKIVEERRKEEEEALKLQLKKEEEEWRKQEERRREEEERRIEEEEDRRKREKAEREAREKERELEEERRKQEEILREELLALMEAEEKHREEEDEQKGWGKQEEERWRWEEDTEREARENQRELEEERRKQEERLREKLLELVEEEEEKYQEILEEEEEVWLRGDVFQMPPKEPEEPERLPTPIAKPPTSTDELEELQELEEIETDVEEAVEVEEEDEEREVLVVDRGSLPPGCDFSDVTVTCDNAKLLYFPPLAIPELKSLSLEGNSISSIPAGAFNGIPNLEWINLKKNKLTSAGIDAKAFKGLKNLRRLYLDGNHLEAVPIDLPSTLQELKINENRLKIINDHSFRGLSTLVILELEGNLLSEGNVAPLAFAPLIQLSYLRMGRNHFRTIPQGLPMSLLELYLENNLIEEISETVFNQTHSLNVISLRHNRLDESRIAPMAWINHRNLESIDLSHNDLYLVPSYLPMSLVHLVLVGNKIERVPGYVFAHMDPGIEYLYLSYNKLDGEGIEPESFFGSYNSMVELCLDHNQLVSVPSGINEMTNLHFLRLNNNNIRSIPEEGICDPNLSGDSTLVAVRLENNYIDPKKISPSAFSCVRSSSSVVLKPQKTK